VQGSCSESKGPCALTYSAPALATTSRLLAIGMPFSNTSNVRTPVELVWASQKYRRTKYVSPGVKNGDSVLLMFFPTTMVLYMSLGEALAGRFAVLVITLDSVGRPTTGTHMVREATVVVIHD
jgi:hypothetical protein